jgi:plastocyanin
MSVRFSAVILLSLLAAGAAACSGNSSDGTVTGGLPTNPSPTPSGPSVTIVSGAQSLTTTAYNPNPLTVAVGATVTWMNNDNTAHTATANTGAFDTGTIQPGGQASKQFMTAGSFPYHCTIHPGMVAVINVQ